MRKSRITVIAGFSAAGVIVAGVALTALSGSSASASVARPSTVAPTATSSAFPKNSSGETYGSSAGLLPANEPELIATTGDNGVKGYVRKEDLEEAPANSPADAVKLMQQASTTRVISLYNINGVKVGTFTITPPTSTTPQG